MQVLTSGSFVNLDNEEKIEQLIFTAKEIAVAAASADGFVNEEENNRTFADEIWQSAEYMCRDHEAARVKGIFANAFLERLRELRGGTATEARIEVAEIVSQNSVAEDVAETETPKDEFLGIVSEETSGESNIQEQNSVAESTNQDAAVENEFFEQGSESEENREGCEEDLRFALPEDPSANAPAETEIGEETGIGNVETETENAGEAIEPEDAAEADSSTGATVAGALRLPDKEPYRWDKCTVTATVQMLPRSQDSPNRKVVLSVRTHDFAPQISMIELAGGDLPAAILPELEKVLSKYRDDLPVKVMDKMKKEKSSAKKQPKTMATTATPKSAAPASANAPATATAAKENKAEAATAESHPATQSNTTAAAAVPPRVEMSRQGSLFG